MAEVLSIEQVAEGVNAFAAAVAADVKDLRNGKVDQQKYCCSGINILSHYIRNFSAITSSDLDYSTATILDDKLLKNQTGLTFNVTSGAEANTDAYLSLGDSLGDTGYIRVFSGQKYMLSFFSKGTVGKKIKIRANLDTADQFLTEDVILSDSFERHFLLLEISATASQLGIDVLGNLDAELGNSFTIAGLMLERVLYTPTDTTIAIAASEYVNDI